eukprot:CAMPEP_0197835000 /NCGR_PEP_ID=MMETSP1437-20131217/24421_1 /TAXON_ID=49252 ORGANISM="Eucampia antarctica, Strain CCMP1452" /NCGR_SAMPLE_ID=MMETSP1437 /ASSEMBLY_ACC=CAM_ASM_001096 /LENGTH=453 /DNA_ID=CAMNT_0043440115 /DNA_START=63 /DNA_END=1424 /DNA_ORIENTATION=+
MKLSIVAVLTLFSAPAVQAFAPGSMRSSRLFRPSHLSAQIDTRESAERNMGSFDEWSSSCGVQRVEGFQLTSQDGLDWSVMTENDLPAGLPILAVPAEMILSSSDARVELEGMSGGGVQTAVDKLSKMGAASSVPKFFLFLKMLVEYEKGTESPYFPWLDSLPRLYYNSVSMTDFCYECLPPLVFSLSRIERVKFESICKVLQEVDIISRESKQDKNLCQWAFNAIHTRCQGEIGGEQRIAPMADMFNHGTETEVEISFDDAGNCNVFTTRDVPAGSPLRVSYGCPTNPSIFFATYGFLDETSPATFCKIMNIQSTPELIDLGFDFSRMLFYKDSGDISQEVWDIVLYSKILAQTPDVKQQFYEAHMSGNIELKQAIHQAYMLETANFLKNHVDSFLTQLEELNAKGAGKDLIEHPRLPLIWSHNEFVKLTFLAVKANLDPMVDQAYQERMAA